MPNSFFRRQGVHQGIVEA